MSTTPDLAGSSGCRTLQASFLSQQGLEVLLFPASRASLMGKSCQSWWPLLQKKWGFHLNIFSLDPSLLLVSVLPFQLLQLQFPQVMLGSEVVIQSGELESTPAKKAAPLSHLPAARFISVMI